MIRVTIDRDSRRIGSMWLNGAELELHAVDEAAYFEAMALAFGALNGRECARTLAPRTPLVCPGCEAGTLDNHTYGHGDTTAQERAGVDSGAAGVEHGT